MENVASRGFSQGISINKFVVEKFFTVYWNVDEKENIHTSDVKNVNKSYVTMVHKPSNVFVLKGKKRVYEKMCKCTRDKDNSLNKKYYVSTIWICLFISWRIRAKHNLIFGNKLFFSLKISASAYSWFNDSHSIVHSTYSFFNDIVYSI